MKIKPLHIWFLAAIVFGYLGGAAYQRHVVPTKADAPSKKKENPHATKVTYYGGLLDV